MSDRLILKNIRREDVLKFKDAPIPGIKGIAWHLGGEVVGIAGLSYYPKFVMGFSDFSDEMRPHLKTITVGRGIKAVQKLIGQCKAPVFAMKNKDEPASAALLERLGFEEVSEELYQWQR